MSYQIKNHPIVREGRSAMHKTITAAVLLFFLFTFVARANGGGVRTWTSAEGTNKTKARLVGVSEDGKNLTMRKTDGKFVYVTLETLSKADQEYVRKRQEEVQKRQEEEWRRIIEVKRKEGKKIQIADSNDNLWKGVATHGKGVLFSKDNDIKFSGDYALKIQHSDYADSAFRKTIPVEKNTVYKVSAMVRHEGYELSPTDKRTGGANLSIGGEWTHSELYAGSEWKRIELEFNSGNKAEVDLALRNGFWGGACKGTAWFSDVIIEKKDMTPGNHWNFLCLIFANIDVTVELNGNKNHRHTARLSRADVAELTRALNRVPQSFRSISNDLMRVSKMDIRIIEKPMTQLTGKWGEGYSINTEDVKEVLDHYLNRETYNQIIVIAPIGELAVGWSGLGGGFYKNAGYCQVSFNPGGKYSHWFADAIFVHEVLHCLESRARGIREVANLHDAGTGKYGFPYDDGKNEWVEWYMAYMRNTLPDKKGLPPEVYRVYNSKKYTVISTDMRKHE